MGIEVPNLEGDALRAVKHRGNPLQIIAAAGSGKTEVVSQRVADLISEGAAPDSIVAFTFTEKAAKELKSRIEQRVESRMGKQAVDRLAAMATGGSPSCSIVLAGMSALTGFCVSGAARG